MQKIGTCNECGTDITINPTAKQRGMTTNEAKSLFLGRTGNKCTDCYIKARTNSVKQLMANK